MSISRHRVNGPAARSGSHYINGRYYPVSDFDAYFKDVPLDMREDYAKMMEGLNE